MVFFLSGTPIMLIMMAFYASFVVHITVGHKFVTRRASLRIIL